MELLEVKFTEVQRPPNDWSSSGFYLSEASMLSLHQFVSYSSDFPAWFLQRLVLLVSCDSLYSSVDIYNLGNSGLPCDLTSLTELRKVVGFSVCSAFYFLFGRC